MKKLTSPESFIYKLQLEKSTKVETFVKPAKTITHDFRTLRVKEQL